MPYIIRKIIFVRLISIYGRKGYPVTLKLNAKSRD